MKKYTLLLALGILITAAASCRKLMQGSQTQKHYTCGFDYYYVPLQVSFVGYTEAELDTLILSSYEQNSNYAHLIQSDTEVFSDLYFTGDTAYRSISNNYFLNTFFSLNDSFDYLIEVASTHTQYKVFNIYANHDPVIWEQDTPCSPGASQARITTYAYQTSGHTGHLYQAMTNNFYLPLMK